MRDELVLLAGIVREVCRLGAERIRGTPGMPEPATLLTPEWLTAALDGLRNQP